MTHGPRTFVYAMTDGTAYKIGVSFHAKTRLGGLQCGNPRKLEVIWCVYCNIWAGEIECNIHKILTRAKRHVRGEWFDLTEAEIMRIKGYVERKSALFNRPKETVQENPRVSMRGYICAGRVSKRSLGRNTSPVATRRSGPRGYPRVNGRTLLIRADISCRSDKKGLPWPGRRSP